MEYPVIVEQKNGVWRAFIPVLADLSAEGSSRDEALRKAKQVAEDYLSEVEITTIEIDTPQDNESRLGSPQSVLKAAGLFANDKEAMLEHIEEIYDERRRQREGFECIPNLVLEDRTM
jgi:predicted RNase H-like HicB family nuclease